MQTVEAKNSLPKLRVVKKSNERIYCKNRDLSPPKHFSPPKAASAKKIQVFSPTKPMKNLIYTNSGSHSPPAPT
jgi:hypothetical protein